MEKPNITFLDYAQLVNLVPGEGGFWAQLLIGDEPRVLSCSYCILCTGGIGRVYPYTTNSAIATGDGITLAHEMGARIRNLHLVQFHPTAFAAAQGRERFLISEAVRGEGATLLNKDGERFMYRYDERGELAPRDVVSPCHCAGGGPYRQRGHVSRYPVPGWGIHPQPLPHDL